MTTRSSTLSNQLSILKEGAEKSAPSLYDDTMFRWLFRKIFLRREIISRAGALHFQRYGFDCPWFGVYLHRILVHDKDKDPHDHPWPFLSLILFGGYVEKTPAGTFICTPLTFVTHKADEPHQVVELFGPTWTLVFRGRRRDTWGYHTDKGWVDHETYRREKHQKK